MSGHLVNVEITDEAEADLFTMYVHGMREWGVEKANQYQARIDSDIDNLAANPQLGTVRLGSISGIRMFPVDGHNLYYQVVADTVLILRILHSSVDSRRIISQNEQQ